MRLLQQMAAINKNKKTALAINNKRGLKKDVRSNSHVTALVTFLPQAYFVLQSVVK